MKKISVLISTLLIASLSINAEAIKPALPDLPAHHQFTLKSSIDRHSLSGVKAYEELAGQKNYSADESLQAVAIPPIFSSNIPTHLADLPTQEKTSFFIRLLLPHILKANDDIALVREKLIGLRVKASNGVSELSASELKWLNQINSEYGLSGIDFDKILERVDTIPVAMVLAQGIDESGWGTSRFAVEGNAIYGQHLASKGGRFILSSNGKVKVAAFDDVYHGTASYMHNLNATHAYASFRELRQNLRNEKKPITGTQTIEMLSHYSERGQAYVKDLKNIIRHYHLERYNNVVLSAEEPPVLITFVQ